MSEALLEKLENMGAEVGDTLKRLAGDEELYIKYLRELPDNKNIVELRRAVDDGDCERAMREVHTLKGIALNLGLLPLMDVCMDMLLDFRSGDNESALEQIDAVEEAFNEWSDAVKE